MDYTLEYIENKAPEQEVYSMIEGPLDTNEAIILRSLSGTVR